MRRFTSDSISFFRRTMDCISIALRRCSLKYCFCDTFKIHIAFGNTLGVWANGSLSRFEKENRFSRFLRYGHKTLIMTNQSDTIGVGVMAWFGRDFTTGRGMESRFETTGKEGGKDKSCFVLASFRLRFTATPWQDAVTLYVLFFVLS